MARKKKDAQDATPGVVDTSAGLRLTDHPRARHQIQTVKSWAGLAGFALGFLMARRAGLPFADATLRALLGGIGTYLLAWAIVVVAWRQVARAELAQYRAMLVAVHAEAEEQAARVRAEREAARAARDAA